MKNIFKTKHALQVGTSLIWGAVLLGVSVFVDAEGSRNLPWELIWVIVGGYIIQSTIIEFYAGKDKKE